MIKTIKTTEMLIITVTALILTLTFYQQQYCLNSKWKKLMGAKVWDTKSTIETLEKGVEFVQS